VIAAIVSAVAAVGAAVFAYGSARTAKKSLDLAQQQEVRRRPRLVPHLAEGYSLQAPERRIYAVSLSVSNPTDTDNAVVRIELQIRYKTSAGILMTMRLSHDDGLRKALARSDIQVLTPPFRVGAHDTAAGWALFELPAPAIGNREIDDYVVLLTDTHALTAEIEPGILRQIESETTTDAPVSNGS
jgi:hypothetical protein